MILKTKNILVMATMSAGKSTVLNALIGDDLLYSGNEAATSTIMKLYTKHSSEFGAISYCSEKLPIDRERLVNNEILRTWNKDERVHHIDVFTNMAVYHKKKSPINLVYIDTPGPNNSQDSSHQELLDSALNNNDINVILYVLNCSQLATNDDYELLSKLHKHIALNKKTQLIFIINKVDVLDEESGESLGLVINNTRLYLESLGFKDPVIIPLMANMALVAKKTIDGNCITRKERSMLMNELERFRVNKHYLNELALLDSTQKKKIRRKLKRTAPLFLHKYFPDHSSKENSFTKKELKQFCSYSGIQTIENILLSN